MNILQVHCTRCHNIIMVNQADLKGKPYCYSCRLLEEWYANGGQLPPRKVAAPAPAPTQPGQPVYSSDKTTRDIDELEKELERAIQEMDENGMLEWEDLWETDGGLSEWEILSNLPPKCECGAEKAGTPFHARWCPLYEDLFGKKDKEEDD